MEDETPPESGKNAMSEAAASALQTFRQAVAEVQRLSSAEEEGSPADEAMKSAKDRLANAMKAATIAGVSEAALLEASTAEEAAEQSVVSEGELKNGSRVEIHGLESETGKQLNGQVGTIIGFLEEKGRYQIALKPDKVVSIRPENLQLQQNETNQTGAETTFQVGNRVEVHGLESEAGRKLNERVGVTKGFLADKGRWTIEMEDTKEVVSVRPCNLTFVEKASDPGSSSSSSSEKEKEREPKEKKKRKRSSANPEDALEAMLKGEKVRTDRKKKSARDAGAQAAWAAQAHETDSAPLKPGDVVEVHGLQSASGQALNGKSGLITKWDETKGRFQVELGMANLQSLKPDNLKRTLAGQSQRPQTDGCGEFGESYSGSTAGYTLL